MARMQQVVRSHELGTNDQAARLRKLEATQGLQLQLQSARAHLEMEHANGRAHTESATRAETCVLHARDEQTKAVQARAAHERAAMPSAGAFRGCENRQTVEEVRSLSSRGHSISVSTERSGTKAIRVLTSATSPNYEHKEPVTILRDQPLELRSHVLSPSMPQHHQTANEQHDTIQMAMRSSPPQRQPLQQQRPECQRPHGSMANPSTEYRNADELLCYARRERQMLEASGLSHSDASSTAQLTSTNSNNLPNIRPNLEKRTAAEYTASRGCSEFLVTASQPPRSSSPSPPRDAEGLVSYARRERAKFEALAKTHEQAMRSLSEFRSTRWAEIHN